MITINDLKSMDYWTTLDKSSVKTPILKHIDDLNIGDFVYFNKMWNVVRDKIIKKGQTIKINNYYISYYIGDIIILYNLNHEIILEVFLSKFTHLFYDGISIFYSNSENEVIISIYD